MQGSAFFISPKGEIIRTPIKHITAVIRNPEKFGLNRDVIEFIHRQYGEKIGQEGKAREQILISLFNQEWIRIREYRNFWTVNVKKLTSKVKQYLQKWAQKLLQGKLGVTVFDPYADIRIDQKGRKVLSSNLKAIAQSPEFIAECKKDIDIEIKIVEELDDLPLYPFAEEIMKQIRKESNNLSS